MVFPSHVQHKSNCCGHDRFILGLIISFHHLLSLLSLILHLSSFPSALNNLTPPSLLPHLSPFSPLSSSSPPSSSCPSPSLPGPPWQIPLLFLSCLIFSCLLSLIPLLSLPSTFLSLEAVKSSPALWKLCVYVCVG